MDFFTSVLLVVLILPLGFSLGFALVSLVDFYLSGG